MTIDDSSSETVTPANRLCSEIQLFDLCDLDRCGHKKDRFCTNDELLRKFEAIREDDESQPLVYDENEFDDEETDFEEFEEEDE